MGRSCTVCPNPKLAAIDSALVAGTPIRALARQYELSRDALARHKDKHLGANLVRVAERRQARQAESVVERLEDLIQRTESMLEAPERSGNVAQFATLLRELRALHELVAKATGELKPEGSSTTVNILTSPDILQVVRAVREVLADQPDKLQRFSDLMRLPERAA